MPAFLTSEIRFSPPSPPFSSYGPAAPYIPPFSFIHLLHPTTSPFLTNSIYPIQCNTWPSPTPTSPSIAAAAAAAAAHLIRVASWECFSLSSATWRAHHEDEEEREECVYSGSGRTPLFCALAAFVVLACAMFMKHGYILAAVSQPTPHPLLAWSPNSISSSGSLVWRACFFFITSWICFAVGEVLLMIGISVESDHLSNWSKARVNCPVNRPGLFAAAGIFGLTTVFLAAGLYLTALRAQRQHHHEATIRREVLEASYMYSSPVTSPTHPIAIPRGFQATPYPMREHAAQPSLSNLLATDKPSNSV
ncbi:hypothetical protein ACLOJK_017707 [Asimina triloba]